MWNPFRRRLFIPKPPVEHNIEPQKPLGDGEAVFLDEGYADEAKDLEREKTGIKAWYDRIKRL